LLLGLLLSLACPADSPAQGARKTFGGAVLEVHPAQRWFLMTGGASKKYPRVHITYDAKTRWTGVPLRGRALKVGERVQVIATPKGEVFRAQIVEVQDPNPRPGALPKP
jgi:hypothetical protein